jgi:hypothetical protein
MRRRVKLFIGVVVILGVVGSFCVYLARPFPPDTPEPGVSWDNAEKISSGMSSVEVERLVGEPPVIEYPGWVDDTETPGCHRIMLWNGAKCDILVYFNMNRQVIRTDVVPTRQVPTWFQRLRYRIGL